MQEARISADIHASRTQISALLVNDGANETMETYEHVVKRERREVSRKTIGHRIGSLMS